MKSQLHTVCFSEGTKGVGEEESVKKERVGKKLKENPKCSI